MEIQFLGAAQTVTGSKHLVTTGKHRFLIDCGLFQGLKELRLRNWAQFPVPPRSIDAVLLTHAHLDHSGHLPLLVKEGFRGRIYCTAPTRDLCQIILSDSAHLQEEDADFANREGYSKHRPAQPLYTLKDVERTMEFFKIIQPHEWEDLPGHARMRLSPSSHILGSTFIEFEAEGKRIVFSGDLGRKKPLLYPPPQKIEHADYVVIESTYGDRLHATNGSTALGHLSTQQELGNIVTATLERGGHMVIPSFAVGRAQELLLLFSRLKTQSKIPDVPIYLDTPMGINATKILCDYPDWHQLDPREVDSLMSVAKIVRSQQESIAVMRSTQPSIVIAGSGMAAGGRVLHHLVSKLPDDRNTVLLVGFQAAGSRGRLLRDGITELKIHGRYVPVKAQIRELTGLSAHADQAEILDWLGGFKEPPKKTFIVHGEPQASDALRVKLQDTLHWESMVPAPLETVHL